MNTATSLRALAHLLVTPYLQSLSVADITELNNRPGREEDWEQWVAGLDAMNALRQIEKANIRIPPALVGRLREALTNPSAAVEKELNGHPAAEVLGHVEDLQVG